MVALAVVSAPVALEVCQITCESKGLQPSMSHANGHAAHHHTPADHASCHEHGGARQQLSPVSGRCDHVTETTPSLVAARSFYTDVSLSAAAPSIDSITLVRTRDFVSGREAWSDRLGIPLAIPLRV
jgi:hypothetical protein